MIDTSKEYYSVMNLVDLLLLLHVIDHLCYKEVVHVVYNSRFNNIIRKKYANQQT